MFPVTLDQFQNPLPSTSLNILSHSDQHANANNAIMALQVKLGIDGSSDPNSVDYKLAAHSHDSSYYTKAEIDVLINATRLAIGSVHITVVNTNPAILLGYGTWVSIGAGRTLVGFDSGDVDFDTAEKTGGAKTVTLTESQIPAHTHIQNAHGHSITDPGHSHLTQRYPTATGASSGFTIDTSMSGTLADNTLSTKSATTGLTVNNTTAVNQNTGGGQAHNNVQPYITVFFWKRIS